ncbi:hypothetical protein MTO96_047087 [Rhipicephalus appendiculatus]
MAVVASRKSSPSGKPQGEVAARTAGLTGGPAGHGSVFEEASVSVKKPSSWWKMLRHFFCRKPAAEESSEEEGVHYREMDEEIVVGAGDLGAVGKVGDKSLNGGAVGCAVDAASTHKQ